MAERIVLQQPGTELVMTLSSVRPETVERNDYYLFANGQKELLVPQSSVKARLEKMGLSSVEQMIGKNVRFARSTKISRANKPYWDIDIVGSGAEQAPDRPAAGNPPAANAVAPSAEPSNKPKMREAYKSLTEWVIKEIAPIYDSNDLEFNSGVLAKCVDSLFREACNAGKVE